MRPNTLIASLLAGCALLAAPSGARAFSDANFFAYPPNGGGSAGRYFTGSPRDAYSCDACHAGGDPPALHVLGLPLSGYVPGAHYELTIDWSDDLEHVSAVAEMTDMQGRRAGALRLPGDDEIRAPERCEDPEDVEPAARAIVVAPSDADDPQKYCGDFEQRPPADCRQVVYVRGCGAQRVRMLWTAPGSNVGPVWFAGAVVDSDNDTTPDGDGVTLAGRAVASPSAAGEVQANTIGCSALPAHRSGPTWMLLPALIAGSTWLRRRSQKRSCRPNNCS